MTWGSSSMKVGVATALELVAVVEVEAEDELLVFEVVVEVVVEVVACLVVEDEVVVLVEVCEVVVVAVFWAVVVIGCFVVAPTNDQSPWIMPTAGSSKNVKRPRDKSRPPSGQFAHSSTI